MKINVENQKIITDFDIFLDYLVAKGRLALTETGQMRMEDLQALNGKLYNKARFASPRSKQQSYSVLSFFFTISQEALFGSIEVEKNKFIFNLDAAQLALFKSFNPTEKYFFLLESFWCFFDIKAVFESSLYIDQDFYATIGKTKTIETLKITNKENGNQPLRNLRFRAGAEILEAFGLFELTAMEKLPKSLVHYMEVYNSAKTTELSFLLDILVNKRYEFVEILDVHTDFLGRESMPEKFTYSSMFKKEVKNQEKPNEARFITAFLPFLEAGAIEKSIYPIPRPVQQGTIQFKVSLDPRICWHVSEIISRSFEISLEDTFEDLHDAIQHLFDFGDDHLYEFIMSKSLKDRNAKRYVMPMEDLEDFNTEFADEVTLGDANLKKGQVFFYLFDYGDEWLFKVQVLKTDSEGVSDGMLNVIETIGESPEQYPDYDEE